MLRWLFVIAFAVVAVSVAAGNWQLLYQKIRSARQGEENTRSFVPFMAGLCGVVALALVETEISPLWYVLPLLADVGSLPYFAVGVFAALARRYRKI